MSENQLKHAHELLAQGGDEAIQAIEILNTLVEDNYEPAKLSLALQKLKSSPPTFDRIGGKTLLDSIEVDETGTVNYLLGEWYGAECLDGKDVSACMYEAHEHFLKAAELGHPEAMLQLCYGYRHDLFPQKSSDKGCVWLEKAAKFNHPRALFELGMHKNLGIGCDKNLQDAQKYLKLAQSFNYPNAAAMAELVGFQTDKEQTDKEQTGTEQTGTEQTGTEQTGTEQTKNWQSDKNIIKSPQSSNVLHMQPEIRELSQILDPMECSHLAVLSMPYLEPSKVISSSGEGKSTSGRTSHGTNFPDFRSDFVVNTIVMRLASEANQAVETAENLTLLKYGERDQYRVHPDYFNTNLPGLEGLLEHGGQRVKTIVCYLNTVGKGGETEFPDLNMRVSAIAGNGVYFENTDEKGNIYTQSRHAGLPVIEGSKWIITLWFRQYKHRS